MSGTIEGYLKPRRPKVARQRRMLPSIFKQGDLDDNKVAQPRKEKLTQRSPDATVPEKHRVQRFQKASVADDDGSNGADSDDGGIGLVTLFNQSTPAFSKTQPAQPVIPSTVKKLTRVPGKRSDAIEDVYPAMFLPLTRENLQIIESDPSLKTLSYPWKNNTVEVDKDQFAQMKRDILYDVYKSFVAFGTSKCYGWAIKTRFPWLNCSTRLFKDLRWDAIHRMGNLKHCLLYEKIYSFLVDVLDEFPEVTSLDDIELVKFLGGRFDDKMAYNIWGPYRRALDIEQTIADPNSLGGWYLRQVFINMGLRMLPLVVKELAQNPRLNWNKKSPSGWIADKEHRKEINGFFDCLCIAPELADVELDDFVWVPEESGATPRPPQRSHLKRHASQINLE